MHVMYVLLPVEICYHHAPPPNLNLLTTASLKLTHDDHALVSVQICNSASWFILERLYSTSVHSQIQRSTTGTTGNT
jgi:hypothetical protein